MELVMNEYKKERLIKTYKIYNTVDWMIIIAMIAIPIVLMSLEGLGMGAIGIEQLIYNFSNLPAAIIVPLFIVYSLYTIFCFVLYVKVWPIKEIPKGFTYWWDWVLSILLVAYELFVGYIILFA